MAYKTPQKTAREGSERLRGEGDQIKFIDLKMQIIHNKTMKIFCCPVCFSG